MKKLSDARISQIYFNNPQILFVIKMHNVSPDPDEIQKKIAGCNVVSELVSQRLCLTLGYVFKLNMRECGGQVI